MAGRGQPPQPVRNQRPLPKKSSAPAGLALAGLAGEDKTPVSFEAVLGAQNFQKYLPVDEEAVNKGVEQFRKHIGKVLRHDSAELEDFIGCMGFSEQEIRRWEQEQSTAEQHAARAQRLTEGAEREIREAEARRRMERERAGVGGGRGPPPRGSQIPPGARGPPGFGQRGPPPPGWRGAPGRAPMPGQVPRGPFPGPNPRGPAGGFRGPPRGPGGPGMPRGMPQPPRAPVVPGRGAPDRGPQPAAPAAPPPTRIADIKPDAPAPKPTDIVLQKSAAFIEKVHTEADALTKKDLEQHSSQMEAEVAKIREQVTRELNDRYRKAMVETSTLQEVKAELARVDNVIAADVAAIREKIDISAAELFEAQRRFDAAEAEFIAAKLEKKMYEDYKVELAEYLVMLIQENQRRKTEKLEELSKALSGQMSSWEELNLNDVDAYGQGYAYDGSAAVDNDISNSDSQAATLIAAASPEMAETAPVNTTSAKTDATQLPSSEAGTESNIV